jgi:amino acid adenylation domain-containing protein
LHDKNLAAAVYRHQITRPDAQAVSFNGQSLTYGVLAELSARLAGCLAQNLASQAAARVGILASRNANACVAVLGTCWAGSTYVPISIRQPTDRILSLLTQCELSAVITDDDGARLLTPALLKACPRLIIHVGSQQFPQSTDTDRNRVIHLAALPTVCPTEPIPVAAAHTAYIIFTSGTTGVPKGVMISAGSARHYIQHVTRWLGLEADDRALETCELSFDFSVHNMFSTWEAGACLHILPANQVMNAVRYVQEAQLTVWNSVPSLAGMLRQVGALKPGSLGSLRKTVFGGEPLTESLVRHWRDAAPNSEVANLYGPTEATVFCLAQNTQAPDSFSREREIAAIGTPLPGIEAGIVDPEGRFLAPSATGELVIAGDQLAQRYLGAPALTQARFPTLQGKRWYRTGDLAYQDPSGVFHCLGRIDHQIKILGYRVELEEIEAHLRAAAETEMVAAVAWPHENGLPTGIVGFIGTTEVDDQQIIKRLRQRIPSYMVPGQIIAMNNLPINPSGKIDRHALQQLLHQRSE